MPSTTSDPPKGWPRDVKYLAEYHIAPQLTAKSLRITELGGFPVIESPVHSSPRPLVRITRIESALHPAHGQSGLFAARSLPPDSFILFYLGFVHDGASSDPTSNYDLSLDRELDLSVDATRYGNEARFINDYRGVRLGGPNAEFRDCAVEIAAGLWERRIGVFVLSAGKGKGTRALGIKKGEEIVVSYGKGFWKARNPDASEIHETN